MRMRVSVCIRAHYILLMLRYLLGQFRTELRSFFFTQSPPQTIQVSMQQFTGLSPSTMADLKQIIIPLQFPMGLRTGGPQKVDSSTTVAFLLLFGSGGGFHVESS